MYRLYTIVTLVTKRLLLNDLDYFCAVDGLHGCKEKQNICFMCVISGFSFLYYFFQVSEKQTQDRPIQPSRVGAQLSIDQDRLQGILFCSNCV